MMGIRIRGASNSSILSLIMAGAGDVGSLAGGHNLCMAGVLLARRFHMRMGGCRALAHLEVTLLVGPWACKAVELVQVPVQGDLTQEEGSKILDCCHFVWWCLLDSFDGISETVCGLQDAIGSCYDRDRYHMMLIAERVRDAFATRFFHKCNGSGRRHGRGTMLWRHDNPTFCVGWVSDELGPPCRAVSLAWCQTRRSFPTLHARTGEG
jgi:hypothetical protein